MYVYFYIYTYTFIVFTLHHTCAMTTCCCAAFVCTRLEIIARVVAVADADLCVHIYAYTFINILR